ncbi:hypothetical protein LTR36_003153 [Oleoguttula mirabilis]|uniref:Sec20 C-terminal domain-containing protein n=1 Tax=Oleoguttula mirabilis TaxID=1507867 RepID=A0AAV9JWU2_9PEZI|nr:hypothetical protein LTR36_003153 [Oleoguttula mirabilis]
MTTTPLAQQLTQLADSLKGTNALITRLSKLAFQPGSEPLDSENSVRIELSQDIHDGLKQLEEDLELLKQEAEDFTAGSGPHKRRDSEKDRDQARLSAQVARLGEDLRHSRSHFRRAQLTAKRASEAAKQKERELVFASIQSTPDPASTPTTGEQRDLLFAARRLKPPQQKQLSNDELEANASTDVTAALRRTHNLLSTELSRSRFAQETFDESTAALADLGEHYTNLDTILSTSRNLLGTLLSSQKSDTWYLETAFYILLATLCWLFFRRILFGPFVKLPLFLWRVGVFLANWAIWRPLFFLLSLSGVITTTPAGTAAARSSAIASQSRPPLIIQPSAQGGFPTFAMSDRDAAASKGSSGIPVGMGGKGAKIGKDAALEGKMSEKIARMHEQSSQQGSGGKEGGEEEELPRRADGTVLQERPADVPRNPKKKMFEADVEDAKHDEQARARDEL